VEARREVGEGRPVPAQGRDERVGVEGVAGDGDRAQHRTGVAEQLDRAGVGGGLGEHGVAGRHEEPGQQRERLLGAGGHEDLVGGGRHTARGVPGRERPAQRGHATRVDAQATGQLGEGPRVRGDELRRQVVGRGAGEVQHPVVGVVEQVREQRVAPRVGGRRDRLGAHPGPAALHPLQPALLPQDLVRRDHRAAADGERRREPPVGWQQAAVRQLAGLDQLPEPGREQQVQRAAAGRPATGERQQAVHAHGNGSDWLHWQTN
jgi:hypothetical protein